MSKKVNTTKYRRGDGSPVDVVTSHIKKGRIKADSKKKVRILKGSCMHHIITKNNKIKPTWSNDGRGKCICKICGYTWSTKLFEKDEVAKKMSGAKELVNQGKFLSQAINADRKTTSYLASLGANLECFPQIYNDIKHVVEKQDAMKRKKKKSRGSSNSSMGYWSIK